MRDRFQKNIMILFLICLPLFYGSAVHASWEIGTKAGFDSNVDRAVEDGRDDVYLSEPVDRNAVGFNAGLDLGKSLFSSMNYTFTRLSGDLGSSESHSGFVSLGYRFQALLETSSASTLFVL